ncbi:MAG: hypothetical protein HKN48_10290 [Flavobacteriaceae bacterium]|nr:hypothetical protein [Flavobacteriaceae bacterium]
MALMNKRFAIILLSIPLLLLIPLIAMLFTNEVNWSLSDFIVMGALLLFTGLVIEILLRLVKNKGTRIALIVIAVVIFLLIWAELAVGVFGTPFAGS